jgi:hypothetical protein
MAHMSRRYVVAALGSPVDSMPVWARRLTNQHEPLNVVNVRKVADSDWDDGEVYSIVAYWLEPNDDGTTTPVRRFIDVRAESQDVATTEALARLRQSTPCPGPDADQLIAFVQKVVHVRRDGVPYSYVVGDVSAVNLAEPTGPETAVGPTTTGSRPDSRPAEQDAPDAGETALGRRSDGNP